METVGELFGSEPRVRLSRPENWPQPQQVWANYDAETDSLLLYLTGKPVRGVHVWLDNNIYVIVDPTTHATVGMYFEAWESSFVPAHADVEQMWRDTKATIAPEKGWSQVLRAIALWLVMLFWQAQGIDPKQSLRPV